MIKITSKIGFIIYVIFIKKCSNEIYSNRTTDRGL